MKMGLFHIVKNSVRHGRRVLDARTYLTLLERLVLSRTYRSDKPQLFILGLPRSGTTLIYQYIVHRLKVAYFTNGVGKYHTVPCVVTFLQHRLYGDYQSDFKSNYGKVFGPVAPREAGSFWGRFFGFEDYIRFSDLASEDVHALGNTIACVQHIYGDAPFVNKNVKHILRIDALSQIFPNAYFLIVERNLKDVALSLIRGRYDNLDNPTKWLSVKPPNYEELKNLSAPEQIAYQLVSIQNKMETDFRCLASDRLLRISYERFCEEPESLILQVQKVLGYLSCRNDAVPHFEQSVNTPQTDEEHHLIALLTNLLNVSGGD